MQITPLRTNYVPRHNNVKFTGDYEYEDVKRARNEGKNDGFESGCIFTTLMSLVGIAVMIGIINTKEDKITKQMLQKVENIYNSDDIQKDTFTVKDMTGDEKPDLILYKKDGSKVVVDMANTKILQEKTVLE